MAKQDDGNGSIKQPGKFLGSLRDALAAASREDTNRLTTAENPTTAKPELDADATTSLAMKIAPPSDIITDAPETCPPQISSSDSHDSSPSSDKTDDVAPSAPPPLPNAADAAREARGGTPNIPPVVRSPAGDRHVEFDAPPTTHVVRPSPIPKEDDEDMARTQLVRGKQQVERGDFSQDPVVGWLVIVGGPGIGSFRPIYEGNNTVGRASSNRVAIDFGDDAISAEEQAYVRYDSADRSFLFVPNLAKTNVVSVNDKRPATAVPLQGMDVITMGRTQIVFVPFCGADFDWSELTELKG